MHVADNTDLSSFIYNLTYTRDQPRVETPRRRYRYLYTDITWLHTVSRLAVNFAATLNGFFATGSLHVSLLFEPREQTCLRTTLCLASQFTWEKVHHIDSYIREVSSSVTNRVNKFFENLLLIAVKFLPFVFSYLYYNCFIDDANNFSCW